MTLCPAIFGRYIPSFDIADLLQPKVKVGCLVRSAVGRSTVEESDQRCRRLLRSRPKWPRGRRAAKQRGEPAPRQVKHGTCSLGADRRPPPCRIAVSEACRRRFDASAACRGRVSRSLGQT